ncbi:SRPBCC domain-containing protein [Tenacibaculum sp.]|uniref:SRPBCC domain-containing protein n=1 Tax=Tenacibaculum sp. TaxID=1906242 RepID=UPI003D0C9EFD
MSDSMIIEEEIFFKTTPSMVWDLLTNPKMTKQYMFGCEVLTDWKIGSQILWNGKTENGEEITYVKGKIIEFENEKKVTSTMFDPNIGIPDIPKNHINLTYEIIPNEIGCKLVITQGDFKGTDNAVKRFEESKQGWKMIIPVMKKILNE